MSGTTSIPRYNCITKIWFWAMHVTLFGLHVFPFLCDLMKRGYWWVPLPTKDYVSVVWHVTSPPLSRRGRTTYSTAWTGYHMPARTYHTDRLALSCTILQLLSGNCISGMDILVGYHICLGFWSPQRVICDGRPRTTWVSISQMDGTPRIDAISDGRNTSDGCDIPDEDIR